MKGFKETLGQRVIIGDGVMGTLLQARITGPAVPDELNLTRPEIIRSIYDEYAKAGADFLTTNTFGASPLKLGEISADLENDCERINRAAVTLAREAADRKGIWVAGNIGPCGRLIDPLGDLSFSQAVDNFARQARALTDAGPDFILIETMTDIQEFRAAVIGALSVTDLPLMASMSFPNEELSISGTDGGVFAVTADFVGMHAVGANCGHSLANTKKVIEKIVSRSTLPVLCQANAGLPIFENGKTVFKVSAAEYADFMEDIYRMGVAVIGSCCGSDPEFTRLLAERFKEKPVIRRPVSPRLFLSTRTTASAVAEERMFLVGERINPTGRKKLRKELREGKLTTIRFDAREQEKLGSDALDLNVNIHRLDTDLLRNIVNAVQNMVSIPLFIDSTDPDHVEIFCRLYPGRGVINSISGEEKSLRVLLPLAAKYNMAFVAALLDEDGIPDAAEGRLAIARKILNAAVSLGIPGRSIIFDPLVQSAGAELKSARVTLDTLSGLKAAYPENHTIMGLSNISFGLPNRELVNSVFLSMAVARGLDMVIANPMHESLRHQVAALNFLKRGAREELTTYTRLFSGMGDQVEDRLAAGSGSLYENILDGDSDTASETVASLLKEVSPLDVVEKHIIPAMNEVGRRYQDGEYFLPQLIAAADVVKAVLPVIKERLPRVEKDRGRGRVLFATVKGDIHDIGKNIVAGILESYNFVVHDLGKNVPTETIIKEAIEKKVEIIGLSTLMTTTIPSLQATVEAIRAEPALHGVEIFIGGAVVTRKLAEDTGARFGRDGIEMVKQLETAD